MKTAYQYIRISNEDQSNFSLSGQQRMNEEYAMKHNIQIVGTFIDDGYSAKDFERPEWIKLESELSKRRAKIDFLIVAKYDRLIRNAAEGLAFIEKLEVTWHIKLLSVMENFFVDPHSPFFFKMRADMLVTAEFERRVISDRSRFGMWSAKTQGRFIGMAPFGYNNERDQSGKPILVINDEESPIIADIFHEYIKDIPLAVIKKKAKKNGLKLEGNDAFKRIFTKHVYAGLVYVPNYKDEAPKVVKGIHQGIVSESVFWTAYYKYQDSIKPQGPKMVDENVPLRGFLLCQSCAGLHTGGRSRGRNAFYFYYRCKRCKGENYSSKGVHQWVEDLLDGLSFKQNFVDALLKEAEYKANEILSVRPAIINQLEIESDLIKSKLTSLEEKYVNDKIEYSTYTKWKASFSIELDGKRSELLKLEDGSQENKLKLFYDNAPYLTKLKFIYEKSPSELKHILLKGIFPGGLTKEKEGGRTDFINPMFYENSLKISNLLRIKTMGEPAISANSPMSSGDGSQVEPFLKVIENIVNQQKAA